ncbi:AbrB/MazE/SpoVT family DNA-binding domain-containing protein [Alkalidesulfovibrio alkalitolerans]|uniref:AbrB/MazE/SpoVT family DNA-binding domain-containing protein n=1 Tax=Alkalidesulfovibrio alkalitolerans TaxID=293256 RepID=UPI001268D8EB|nr:AbrB/MazE/SpoVT family DNA-binding domain-containing protein [Alkalidesulfovibrio alkalitolerans]
MRVRIVGNGILELPRQIVRHFGFVAGDEVEVFLDGDRVVVYPVRSEIEGGTGDREREGLLDAESRRRDLERRLRREFDES